ncbi:chloride channel protein [Weissella minor]|uniref:chloride channel protein n=1 Tax=Weissella minor TaxID=1620 RepID=UPI003AF21881
MFIKKENQQVLLRVLLKSLVAGVVVAIFAASTTYLSDTLWSTLPKMVGLSPSAYTFVVCLVGGLLLGVLQKYAAGYPRTIAELTVDKHLGETYRQDIPRVFITSMIVLSFGGSVGPEAPLAGLIVGLFQWMKPDLNSFTHNNKAVRVTEGSHNVHIIAGISALLAFLFTYRIFDTEKNELFGIFKQFTLDWGWQQLYLLPLAILTGVIFGIYFKYVTKWTEQISNRMTMPQTLRPIVGGIIIGAVGYYSTMFLFSGQQQLIAIVKQPTAYSLAFLMLVALGKPILSNVGFYLGWRGGLIFPAMLSSFLFAGVLASLVGIFSPIFVIVTSLAASVFINRSPLIMALVYLVLCPLSLYPVVIIVAWTSKYLGDQFVAHKLV